MIPSLALLVCDPRSPVAPTPFVGHAGVSRPPADSEKVQLVFKCDDSGTSQSLHVVLDRLVATRNPARIPRSVCATLDSTSPRHSEYMAPMASRLDPLLLRQHSHVGIDDLDPDAFVDS